METRRLYYEDHSLLEFRARVVSVSGKELLLDATAFFPGGGGQEPDRGEIGGTAVVDVKKRGGEVVHIAAGEWPVAAGAEVEGKVDRERRRALMRAHTAEHLLMGELQRRFGAEIEKVAIRPGSGTLFLKGTATWEQIAEAQRATNEHIRAGLRAEAKEMPASEARKIPGVRISERLDGREMLRILDIGGVDRAACAGMHMHDTSGIVALLVTSVNIVGKKAQISFSTGAEAVVQSLDDSLRLGAAAAVLNSDRADLRAALQNLSEENQHLRKSLKDVLSTPPSEAMIAGASVVDLRLDGLTARMLGEIAASMARRPGAEKRIVVLSASLPRPSVSLAVGGLPQIDCGKLMSTACGDVGGKGGGSRELATGSAPEADALKQRLLDALRLELSR